MVILPSVIRTRPRQPLTPVRNADSGADPLKLFVAAYAAVEETYEREALYASYAQLRPASSQLLLVFFRAMPGKSCPGMRSRRP